ncbi:Zn-dependent protease with chaperone function [Sphingomonas sp. UYAg733]
MVSEAADAVFTPVRPVLFQEEQARRRRGTWRATLACIVAACIAGLFLSIVLLLFAPAMLGVLLGLIVRCIRDFGFEATVMKFAYGVAENPNRNAILITTGVLLVLPAFLPPPLAWIWLRWLMLRPQATPWPDTIGVRAPAFGDAEEHQFGNLVAEMALAAGLPTPAVGLIDAAAPNLAAFGTAHDHAGIVATRGLLDTLGRGDTQALVAQAMGSIGNGDLRISASLLAAYRAICLFLTLIDLPFRRDARRAIGLLIAASFGRVRADVAFEILDSRLAGQRLLALLFWLPMLLILPGVIFWSVADKFAVDKNTPWGAAIPALLLLAGSAVLFYGLVRLTLGVWTIIVLRWPLAMVWRSRRFLADATAVQLAGDPDAQASALSYLRDRCGLPPGCGLWGHAFLCQPVVATGRHGAILDAIEPDIASRLARLRALGATVREGAPVVIPAMSPGEMKRLGILAVILLFLAANYKLTGLILAIGLIALLATSAGAGLLIFTTIMNV